MQQKKNLVRICSIVLLLGVFAGISSCNKKFDAPPAAADTPIPAGYTQISVKDLKARHTVESAFDAITDKVALEVIVTANDKSGNLYKQLFVEDATGAIQVLLDQAGLYGPYPVGRKLWIKCDGLTLSDDGGVPVIGVKFVLNGVPQMAGVEPQRIREHIVAGSINNPVVPKVVNVDDLGFDLQDENIGRLIQIQGFQFNYPNTTYSDTSNYRRTVNVGVKNCSGDTIIVRNSAYASFAGYPLPKGNGTLTAIYTVFTATSRPAKQLLIRDTSDVQFTDFRCGQGPTTLLPTADLRALFTGAATTVPNGKRITGVVISDRTTNNINARNIVLQQGSGLAGVLVRFAANHSFNLGDTIDVIVSGMELSEFNGLLQVNNVPLDFASLLGSGKSITPRDATVADINTNFEAWESTLVKVTGVTLSPAGTWSGSTTVTQSGANTIIFTASAATFSGVTKPTGTVDVTAYLSQGGTAKTQQLTLRSTSDVTGGGGGGTGTVLLDENFETVTTTGNTPIALTGWKNIGETGGIQYLGKLFSGNKYAQITAFNSTVANQKPVVKSWLITPAINLDGTNNEILTFKTIDGFNNGATLKVYYSTNYDGGTTPSSAIWTELSATIATGTTTGYAPAFVPSGDVLLNSITGTSVYFAFVYEGGYTAPNKTTTYQIDDVKIVGN